MNATATLAPARTRTRTRTARTASSAPAASPYPQYMRALQRANEVRLARAELKRRVATGEVDVVEVLQHRPWETESMAVADLLVSQRRWGDQRCRKFLAQAQIPEKKTIGSMTDRQRQTLIALLRGANAYELTGIRRANQYEPCMAK